MEKRLVVFKETVLFPVLSILPETRIFQDVIRCLLCIQSFVFFFGITVTFNFKMNNSEKNCFQV